MVRLNKTEDRISNALSLQRYDTGIGYEIKVVTIGQDTHITATPSDEYLHIAPKISFISKESRVLELGRSSVAMGDVKMFAEWVSKAAELLEYIYEHYEEFVSIEPEAEVEK